MQKTRKGTNITIKTMLAPAPLKQAYEVRKKPCAYDTPVWRATLTKGKYGKRNYSHVLAVGYIFVNLFAGKHDYYKFCFVNNEKQKNMKCQAEGCGNQTKKMANGIGYRKTCSKTCLKNLQSQNAHRIGNESGSANTNRYQKALKYASYVQKSIQQVVKNG